ncbi:MAG: DUF1571 domain-containing protein [Chitinophagales bacterium]|nr:DUF1571 domain-containing protein [Chitinophagales bacterium]
MNSKQLLVIFFLIAYCKSHNAQQTDVRALITDMLNAIKNAKGYIYTMKGTERLIGKNEYKVTEVFTKVNVSPKKIFARVVNEPNKGTEMLYVAGERDNKILVKSGWVPALKLSPFSSLLMKDQHHSLLSAGFGFFYKNISEGIRRADAQDKFNTVFKLDGEITYEGRKCFKLIVEDPTYSVTEYKASKGENTYTISQKLLVPECFIMEANGIKSIDENLEGKTLKVPTSYAKRSIIYIDKQNNFPIYQEMWDNKGMFEKYEFKNLIVNPTFAENEFSTEFKDYSF